MPLGEDRRSDFKRKGEIIEESQRRRNALSEQQNANRKDLIDQMRRIAMESLFEENEDKGVVVSEMKGAIVGVGGDDDDDMIGGTKRGRQDTPTPEKADSAMAASPGSETKTRPRKKKNTETMDVDEEEELLVDMAGPDSRARIRMRVIQAQYWAKQLMHPDWMTDIPDKLATEWFAYMKPEGDRVLVVSDGGRTCARSKTGRVMKRWRSALPRGLTLLEAVWSASDETFYILDVLIWGDSPMLDATAECRHFWMQSRFSEAELEEPRQGNKFAMMLQPWHDATPENLQELYETPLVKPTGGELPKDSFVFVHRESQYWPGLTPLVLYWRDRHVSKWLIDTMDPTAETVPTNATCCLELRKGGWLRTFDRHVIAQLPESSEHRSHSVETLLRVEVGRLNTMDNSIDVISVAGKASKSRLYADSLARITFQQAARDGEGVSFDDIQGAALMA